MVAAVAAAAPPLGSTVAARRSPAPLPTAAQLAGLGPVLCVHRASEPPLLGWTRARRAVTSCGIDSDGFEEALLFYDDDDRCCWRLHLLPDSDFLAWDALCGLLPTQPASDANAGPGERLWQRLAGRLRAGRWRCSVLRLHAVQLPKQACALALSNDTLTRTGLQAAQRIARALDAEDAALRDDCCCEQTARRAAARERRHEPAAPIPLVRLETAPPETT